MMVKVHPAIFLWWHNILNFFDAMMIDDTHNKVSILEKSSEEVTPPPLC